MIQEVKGYRLSYTIQFIGYKYTILQNDKVFFRYEDSLDLIDILQEKSARLIDYIEVWNDTQCFEVVFPPNQVLDEAYKDNLMHFNLFDKRIESLLYFSSKYGVCIDEYCFCVGYDIKNALLFLDTFDNVWFDTFYKKVGDNEYDIDPSTMENDFTNKDMIKEFISKPCFSTLLVTFGVF